MDEFSWLEDHPRIFFLPWIHEVNLTEICKTTYEASNRFHEN